MPEKGFLIKRIFRLLAQLQAISNLGDFVYSTTLLSWVFVLTHSTAMSCSYVAERNIYFAENVIMQFNS